MLETYVVKDLAKLIVSFTEDNRQHEGLSDFAADHRQTDRGDGQGQGEEDHESDTAVPAGAVRYRFSITHRRIDIRHGLRKYPIRIDLTGDCHKGQVLIRPLERLSFQHAAIRLRCGKVWLA